MRVEKQCHTKNHLSITIEVSKPLLQERKGDLHGKESNLAMIYPRVTLFWIPPPNPLNSGQYFEEVLKLSRLI